MMADKKRRYPGTEEAERQKSLRPSQFQEEEPDTFGLAPNYEKFIRKGFTVEEVLVWFNMD